MIDKQYGKITIVCDTDGCPEKHEGERGESFEDVWEAAKAKGWKTRKIAGEWLHGCADCGAPT